MDLRDPLTGLTLFTHTELECKATHVVKLGKGFTDALVELRRMYARPMRVTSCCRSRAHNDAVGGHYRSLHVYDDPYHPTEGTVAIDLVLEPAWLHRLVRCATTLGWSFGIRWDANIIHLDRRGDFGMSLAVFKY